MTPGIKTPGIGSKTISHFFVKNPVLLGFLKTDYVTLFLNDP